MWRILNKAWLLAVTISPALLQAEETKLQTCARIARNGYLSQRGLNEFGDEICAAYTGGNPLFEEDSGKSVSLADYMGRRGLNVWGDPRGTGYLHGNPLFDSKTSSIRVKYFRLGYLAAKGLNAYGDDHCGTVYSGGSPLYNERTGRQRRLSDYMAERGLNIWGDAIGSEMNPYEKFCQSKN